MASVSNLHELLYALLLVAAFIAGSLNKPGVALAAHPCSFPPTDLLETEQQGLRRQEEAERWSEKKWRRLLIGSRAPTCTYNECRGCRHRCSAREVPVDASDPMNSAYHYKCICHM